jgi:phosphate starvation-inducible membrane PsiE
MRKLVTPTEILREIAYPLTHAAVLMTMVLLYLVLSFAAYGGVLGLFLLFLILPALFRYLMVLLQWRANGLEDPSLEVDHLSWFGNAWSIFPALLAVLITLGLYSLSTNFGPTVAYVVAIGIVAVLPASLAVLAISRSPLMSLNPASVGAVIQRCGNQYWIAPTYVLVAGVLASLLHRVIPYTMVRGFITFYLLFGLFALIGGIIRSENLMQEADIPGPVEPGAEVESHALIKARTTALDHAYGFISRGNRAGGFKHIEQWLRQDPDPRSGWEWMFQQMLRWENNDPALTFGQSYLHQLLHNGERVAAVKVMLRCRLENERFIPLPEDMTLAIEAAEESGNQDLAGFLRSRV